MFFILHLSLHLTPVVIRPNLGHSSKGWEHWYEHQTVPNLPIKLTLMCHE